MTNLYVNVDPVKIRLFSRDRNEIQMVIIKNVIRKIWEGKITCIVILQMCCMN